MKKLLIGLVICLPVLLLAQPGDDLKKNDRREKMEAVKIAYMTSELDLSPEESQQFWPVYNEYQRKLKDLRKDSRPNKRFEDISDAEAEDFLNLQLDLETQKLELQRNTIQLLKPIIGAKRIMIVNKAEDEFRRKLLRKAGKRQEKGERKRKKKGFRDDQ